MKTKIQLVLASLSHEEARLIFDLVSSALEDQRCFEDSTEEGELKRKAREVMLETLEAKMLEAVCV